MTATGDRANFVTRCRRVLVGPAPVVPLAGAHVLSAAADAFVTVSLAGSLFFNVSPDASREQVLLYLVVTMAPLAVLSPLVGPAIDRFRRSQRYVAAGFYAARGALCLVLALTLLQLAFYPIVLAVLVLNKASGVVKQTLVQTLVDDPDELVATNARLARSATVVAAAAVGLASAVFATFGPEWSLRTAAVLLALAALTVMRVRPRVEQAGHDEVEYVEAHLPVVIVSSIGLLAIRAAVGFFVFTLAFTLRRSSEPAYVYGLGAAMYGLGAFAGHTAATTLRRWFREERLIAVAIALPAAFAIVGTLGTSIPLLMVISALVGLSTTLGRNAFDGLLQRRAPAALLGRAGARYETFFQLAWVFGGVLATPISLPVEVSMIVLTALYIPALVLVLRGVTEADRFDVTADEFTAARLRLASAQLSAEAGASRAAVIDAVAAADLAFSVVGAAVHPGAHCELEVLRRRATDIAVDLDDADVARALAVADDVISVASLR